jgi:hypothetical protein
MNILDRPLGSLTLGEILHAAGFSVLAVLLVRGLFNPSEAPEIRKAWTWLGALIIAGLLLMAFLVR